MYVQYIDLHSTDSWEWTHDMTLSNATKARLITRRTDEVLAPLVWSREWSARSTSVSCVPSSSRHRLIYVQTYSCKKHWLAQAFRHPNSSKSCKSWTININCCQTLVSLALCLLIGRWWRAWNKRSSRQIAASSALIGINQLKQRYNVWGNSSTQHLLQWSLEWRRSLSFDHRLL